MNTTEKAKARAARQRAHREKTGGLVPRQHVEHAYDAPETRHASIVRGEALLAALATRSGETVTITEDGNSLQLTVRQADALSGLVIADAELRGHTDQPWVLPACPKCGATGDEPCRKPNGRKADSTHKGRGDV